MQLPVNESIFVATDLLHFDQHTPRFTPNKRPDETDDESIIRFIDRTADLGELIESMAANGYIKIEPMIVWEYRDKLVVLEGNRRLAALKCLRDPSLAVRIGVELPEISAANRATLDEVSVWRVEDRSAAQDLIGYKHINGPHPWDAYAKALFAMRWLEAEKEKSNRLSLMDITKKMGDRHDTLRRMVTAAFVFKQAEENNIWPVDQRKNKHFSFSHLCTGLSYGEFLDFLGMERLPRSEDPTTMPVPKAKYKELSQLLSWLYGNKGEDEEPVIRSQVADLKKLRNVLGNKGATQKLAATRKLDDADIAATPRFELFAHNVYNAQQCLAAALQYQSGFDDLDSDSQLGLIDTLRLIRKDVEVLNKAMGKDEQKYNFDD